jgi:hypothetical protein
MGQYNPQHRVCQPCTLAIRGRGDHRHIDGNHELETCYDQGEKTRGYDHQLWDDPVNWSDWVKYGQAETIPNLDIEYIIYYLYSISLLDRLKWRHEWLVTVVIVGFTTYAGLMVTPMGFDPGSRVAFKRTWLCLNGHLFGHWLGSIAWAKLWIHDIQSSWLWL